jgi:glycosyltransferase involved in cell wall biosynthesis
MKDSLKIKEIFYNIKEFHNNLIKQFLIFLLIVFNYSKRFKLKYKLIFKILIFLISLLFSILEFSLNYKFLPKKFYNDLQRQLKRNKRKKINITINKENPYFSIVIPLFNMEKYIERAILSILNQTFQKFEIIIINDFSNDNSKKIVQKYLDLNKIKFIEHKRNLGIFASRMDGFINSIGNYLLFVDPDDMILNPFLLEQIYNFNQNYNLDIIEFSVYHQKEGIDYFYFPKGHSSNHFHNFSQKIIYQPKLSNLLFYVPNTNNYSDIICRPIWNKVIKRNILFKSFKFIQKGTYKNKHFNYAEDTLMNIINFQYAKNYSNINIPSYLYNTNLDNYNKIYRKINKLKFFFLFSI